MIVMSIVIKKELQFLLYGSFMLSLITLWNKGKISIINCSIVLLSCVSRTNEIL